MSRGIKHLFSPEASAYPRLEDLFAEYYDRLVFFALQMLKDRQQAEDTAQDAFIAYWQKHTEVATHPAAIKNFLYRSVKNACLNILRHDQVVNLHQSGEQGPAYHSYIIESIISAEMIAEVHNAINDLPEQLRLISKLSFLEGKKNQEIADELNMSVNTVKKQKQLALKLLKLKIHPDLLLLTISVIRLLS